jgi:hypothetical protein
MELLMRRLITVVLIVAISACSTVQTVPPAPAEVCAQPGLWAVVARPGAEAGDPPVPLSGGSAAAAGAKAGALGSLKTGAGLAGEMLSGHSSGDFAGLEVLLAGAILAAGVVIAPVAALVGAGVGAGVAHPDAAIAAAQKDMAAALDAARPADAIRTSVIVLADQRARRRLYDCGGLATTDACQQQSPESIAVVLSMTVSAPYFEVEGAITPDLRLLLSADAEVVGTSDAGAVYRRGWIYRGRQYSYFELAADDAAVFRAELKRATDALASKVVDDLLIGGREEVHPSGEQPEGTVWTVFPPGRWSHATACP